MHPNPPRLSHRRLCLEGTGSSSSGRGSRHRRSRSIQPWGCRTGKRFPPQGMCRSGPPTATRRTGIEPRSNWPRRPHRPGLPPHRSGQRIRHCSNRLHHRASVHRPPRLPRHLRRSHWRPQRRPSCTLRRAQCRQSPHLPTARAVDRFGSETPRSKGWAMVSQPFGAAGKVCCVCHRVPSATPGSAR